MSLKLPDPDDQPNAGVPATISPALLAALTAPPQPASDPPTLGTGAMLVCPHCGDVLHVQLTACELNLTDAPPLSQFEPPTAGLK
jgi:hypothetical protein